LPEGRTYYTPNRHGAEARIADRLEAWRHQFEEAKEAEGIGNRA